MEYPKIENVYQRDEATHLYIDGAYKTQEFAYLAFNQWRFTEQVDGMNIRVVWNPAEDTVNFFGKTDRAEIPKRLIGHLSDTFPSSKFWETTGGIAALPPMVLYGEGYGAGIQKGGCYIPDGVGFILFDILVDPWWLRWDDVLEIAGKLEIDTVPVVDMCNLPEAVQFVRDGFSSAWGDFRAEGVVGKPVVDLFDRNGRRVVVKIKTKDFGGK
jgi:hypothetical protein